HGRDVRQTWSTKVCRVRLSNSDSRSSRLRSRLRQSRGDAIEIRPCARSAAVSSEGDQSQSKRPFVLLQLCGEFFDTGRFKERGRAKRKTSGNRPSDGSAPIDSYCETSPIMQKPDR